MFKKKYFKNIYNFWRKACISKNIEKTQNFKRGPLKQSNPNPMDFFVKLKTKDRSLK